MRRVAISFFVLFLSPGAKSQPRAESPVLLQRVFILWHHANLSELSGDQAAVCSEIDSLIDISRALPTHISEWYTATGSFLRARADARLGNPEAARQDIARALEHRFRNDGLIRLDTVLVSTIGEKWLDSLIKIWIIRHHEMMKKWDGQPIEILAPHSNSSGKMPLFIALHGGNGSYEEFALHLLELPDSLGAIIAVPPGDIRLSNTTNSWGPETIAADSLVIALLDSLRHVYSIDESRVYLLGFSQGAATAIGCGFRHPDLFRGVISLSGICYDNFSDPILSEDARRDLRLYAITGKMEVPVFGQTVQELLDKCKNAGIATHLDLRSGMFHEVPLSITSDVISALGWMSAKEEHTPGKRRGAAH